MLSRSLRERIGWRFFGGGSKVVEVDELGKGKKVESVEN